MSSLEHPGIFCSILVVLCHPGGFPECTQSRLNLLNFGLKHPLPINKSSGNFMKNKVFRQLYTKTVLMITLWKIWVFSQAVTMIWTMTLWWYNTMMLWYYELRVTQTKRIFGKFRIVFTGQIGELLAVIKDAYILQNYCQFSKAKSNRFLPPLPSLYI